jgi:hypothetical protein
LPPNRPMLGWHGGLVGAPPSRHGGAWVRSAAAALTRQRPANKVVRLG